ncbi:unnamed protein product [Fusarium equiseti]|uniref:F-box domain-containing protein n=1 Tax=Fusarium equiseti TaxID=61235 RepID=A0A8J2ITI2_FUSEQ|nr:unnamed protein product [Fusarium equiseti]
MSSKTLLGLPDELPLCIFDHLKVQKQYLRWKLEGRDIKTLRATCKKLNRIASPYLYQTLYLSCHQLDLEVFHLVARNPLLIGSVCELVIDDTTFPTCINDWDTYKRAVTLLAYIRRDPVQDGNYDDNDYYPKLEGLAHHENRLAHADIAALKKALPKMKSLRSLVVTNCTVYENRQSGSPLARMWRSIPQPSSAPSWRRWGAIPLAPRCDWMPHLESADDVYSLDWLDDRLFTTVQSGEPDHGSVDYFKDDDLVFAHDHYYIYRFAIDAANDVGSDPEILSREARVLHVALQVLEDPNVGPQLQEFRVTASTDITIDCSPGLAITLFDHLSPFTDRVSRAFSTTNMTNLRLVLSNFEDHRKGRKIMDQGGVTQLLASMPQLEELYFEPHGMATVGAPPEIAFPRLRKVEFCCGEVNPDKLIRFLERQGSTLKSLRISVCSIIPGVGQVWQDVADRINCFQREHVMNFDYVSIFKSSVCKIQGNCVAFEWIPSRSDGSNESWYLFKDGFLTKHRYQYWRV